MLETPPLEEIAMVNILSSDTLEPQNMGTFALRYGFIQRVEYLVGYDLSSNVSSMATLVGAPRWSPLTPNKFTTAKRQKQLLLCRMKSHSTLLSDFRGLPVSSYNDVFLLGVLNKRPLPSSSPEVSSGRYQMLSALSDRYSNILEYSISYDKSARIGNESLTTYESLQAPSPRSHLGPRRGSTSLNLGHRHEYIIDADGNGIAKEACSSKHTNICHSHPIINGVVQSAGSKDISPTKGISAHTHKLARPARPSSRSPRPRQRGARRGTSSGGGY